MKNETKEIHSWAVFGERGSGTRWVTQVVHRHAIRSANLTNGHITRWKHALWGDWHDYALGPQTLIIIVRKDIYAWLPSLHRKPWHMPHLSSLPFSKFIRSEYHSVCDGPRLQTWYDRTENEELPELPNGERWPNLVQMWASKYHAWEQVNRLIHPVVHLDYLNMIADPAAELEKLKKFNIVLRPFLGVADYARRDYYLSKAYMKHWNYEDQEFVEDQLQTSQLAQQPEGLNP